MGEFAISKYFESKEILHQTSCVETPKQNGIYSIEKTSTFLKCTRALIFQSNISTGIQSYDINYVVFLINCMPTPFINDASPYKNYTIKM